jgi:hypothetical protein
LAQAFLPLSPLPPSHSSHPHCVLPLDEVLKIVLDLAQWLPLAILVGFGLAVVYRFGPATLSAL